MSAHSSGPATGDSSVPETGVPECILIVDFGSQVTQLIARRPTAQIEAVLGFIEEPELIHRDNLVLS